jgi:hypothetical protein
MPFGSDNAQRIVDVVRISPGGEGGRSPNFCIRGLTFLFNMVVMNVSSVSSVFAVQVVLFEVMAYWFCLRIFHWIVL